MCKKGGIWHKPENVLLLCVPNGKIRLQKPLKIKFSVDQIAEALKIAKENVKKYEAEIENLKSEIENCNKPALTEWSNWSVCSCEGSSLKV